jgi:hypothetical protein
MEVLYRQTDVGDAVMPPRSVPLLRICVVFVAAAAPCYLLTPLQFLQLFDVLRLATWVCWVLLGGGRAPSQIWTKKKDSLRSCQSLAIGRLGSICGSLRAAGGNNTFRCLWFRICLGMDTLDFSYLDMLWCRLWWVHTCARFVLWYACMAPGFDYFDYFHSSCCHTTPSRSPRRNCGGSDVSASATDDLFLAPYFCGTMGIVLLFLLRPSSLWPNGLRLVVVDARMIDVLLPNLFMKHRFLAFGEMCMLHGNTD